MPARKRHAFFFFFSQFWRHGGKKHGDSLRILVPFTQFTYTMLAKSLAVLLLLVNHALGLHFYLHTNEMRCFFEELPEDALVVGKIDATEYSEHTNGYVKNNNLYLQITVDETFDNNHRVVSQKSSPGGVFTFTSIYSGEHKFCLTPMYTDGSSNKQHRVFFDIALGSAHDYVDSKSTKKVDALTLKVQGLNRKLEEIHREQDQLREREAAFRNMSESTNTRVVKWSIVQLIVLVGTCFYQLRHLKSFFVKQKIV